MPIPSVAAKVRWPAPASAPIQYVAGAAVSVVAPMSTGLVRT